MDVGSVIKVEARGAALVLRCDGGDCRERWAWAWATGATFGVSVADVIEAALTHAREAHGIDEIRGRNGPESRENRATTIEPGR